MIKYSKNSEYPIKLIRYSTLNTFEMANKESNKISFVLVYT
jgi:hypothetical protein